MRISNIVQAMQSLLMPLYLNNSLSLLIIFRPVAGLALLK